MATRREVREAFYDELETAATSHLTDDDIGQEFPNSKEDLPRIVHADRYRKVPWNNNGAPLKVADNGDGTYDVYYATMMEAQFEVLVVSDSEQEKEDIYEDVRGYFEKFEHPRWPTSSIQTDVHDVNVTGSDSEDTEDRDPPMRGDRFTVELGFKRFYTFTADSIDEIDQQFDVDGQSTNLTYTTT